MSFQQQPKRAGSPSVSKSQFKLKMILYLGMVLFISWALYLVVSKTRISEVIQLASSSHDVDGIDDAKQYDLNVPTSNSEILQILDLPTQDMAKTGNHRDSGRLIIVGDVHGMLHELTALLDKVKFDKSNDRLILAGDMISKGPDSPGVVDLAMSLGAASVRGNHEDHIIVAHAAMSVVAESSNLPRHGDEMQKGKYNPEELASRKVSKDLTLARILGDERIRWLKKCPLILRVGKLGVMGEVIVVHAGLEPGVKLQKQDPYMAMNMRTISESGVPSDEHAGVGWMNDWNKYQKSLPKGERTTVIYGHDSKRGLQMEQYSMGIDTGCVKGGRLTAVVIEDGYTEHKFKLVQVDCPDGRSR